MGVSLKKLWEKSKICEGFFLIFVSVGAGKIGFERLITEIDRIAGIIEEPVILQIGISEYEPVNADYFRFLPREEIIHYYKNARIVICHAGIGSIITALEMKKPVIVVPRLKKLKEHHDDHQLEIARELEKANRVAAVYNIDDLYCVIEEMDNVKENYEIYENELIATIKEFLSETEKKQ